MKIFDHNYFPNVSPLLIEYKSIFYLIRNRIFHLSIHLPLSSLHICTGQQVRAGR